MFLSQVAIVVDEEEIGNIALIGFLPNPNRTKDMPPSRAVFLIVFLKEVVGDQFTSTLLEEVNDAEEQEEIAIMGEGRFLLQTPALRKHHDELTSSWAANVASAVQLELS